jgi:hypothetical protein
MPPEYFTEYYYVLRFNTFDFVCISTCTYPFYEGLYIFQVPVLTLRDNSSNFPRFGNHAAKSSVKSISQDDSGFVSSNLDSKKEENVTPPKKPRTVRLWV